MIADERNSNTNFLKHQQQVDQRKKNDELDAWRSLPPGYISPEQQVEMQWAVRQEFQQKKRQNEAVMREDYSLYQQKKNQEQQDRAAQISQEQQELNNIQKELAYEKSRQLSEKYERGVEAKSTINDLEWRK